MKYLYEKLLPPPQDSFFVHDVSGPVIECVFHVHPEYELVYVESSFGTRFAGDSISTFSPGNLALFGPMLPHHYYNSPSDSKSSRWGHVKLVQFKENFAGASLFEIPEMAKVRKMLDASEYGIEFKGPVIKKAIAFLPLLSKAEGGKRISLLIELLSILSEGKYVRLSTVPASSSPKLDERIDKIIQFIHNEMEAGREVSLHKAASLVSMSQESFSRYFRKICMKGFISYVIEQRIGKACGMLTNTSKNISEICFACGFNNLSNFNRHFFNVKGVTPRVYRNKIHRAY